METIIIYLFIVIMRSEKAAQGGTRLELVAASGKQIHVTAIPLGSGDCIDELLNGDRQADIASPASAAFIKLGNAESRVKTGQDLLGDTQNLVLLTGGDRHVETDGRSYRLGQKAGGLVGYIGAGQGSARLDFRRAAAMGSFSFWSYASRIEQQRTDFSDGGSLCRRGESTRSDFG
jgi:hypothetical protein